MTDRRSLELHAVVLRECYIHEILLIRPYFRDNLLCHICLFQDRVHSCSTTNQLRGMTVIHTTYSSSTDSARMHVLLWRSRSLISSRVRDLDKGHLRSVRVRRLRMLVLLDGFGAEAEDSRFGLAMEGSAAAEARDAFLSKPRRIERISFKVFWQA